ncbi:HlyD family type I secretion periplasmic adaptor subunit [Xanthobacter sp. DSM 24535]|uniref:HlyD family type I secretion periplasmic adaptor subunit n=1 Tax=Roseixanthobacter psychrophilus TaxID=3119917 RepID=UPI00372874D6
MLDNSYLLKAPEAPSDWKSTLSWGYLVLSVTVVVLFVWAAFSRIDGAVIASGVVSVESNRKTIQHLEGGIVSEILVRDGSVVNAGDVLVRLDPTRSAATEQLYTKQLAQALALEARLEAQRNMAETITFPPEVLAMVHDPLVADAVNDNKKQFESRRDTLRGALSVVAAQNLQAQRDIEQAQIQHKNSQDQLLTINQELAAVRELQVKGLVSVPRVAAAERQQLAMQAQIDASSVAEAKAREKIQELTAQAEQLRKEYRQEAANMVSDVRKTISDARQQIVVAGDSLSRVEIKAPVSGIVQQMKVFTIGGVIRAGDPIMDIVPASDTLVIRARVSTVDIDRVMLGEEVQIQLPQFQSYGSTIMMGKVRTVTGDAQQDSATSAPYYAVEVDVDRRSIPAEINDKLMPGMTATAIMPTGKRTVLQYLVSPLVDRVSTALRER